MHSTDPSADDERKLLGGMQAQAAYQKRIAVDGIDGDNGKPEYCISKWRLTRHCRSFYALSEMLARMGVQLP